MKFIINGGKKLGGEIFVSGSKNAATPIIAATLLVETPCILSHIPRIGDVMSMLDILKSIGSKQRWIDEHTIEIINDEIQPENLDQTLVAKIRSSILVIGPLLARFGKVEIVMPGGCLIGSRPIDAHSEAFISLGAEVVYDADSGKYAITLKKPQAQTVILRERSVTGTENILMFGALHPLTIKLAAEEPHVEDLGRFLEKLGVQITGLGTHTITTNPTTEMSTGNVAHTIVYDAIEMGTFAVLAAATKSDVVIHNVTVNHLDAVLGKLSEMGVSFSIDGNTLTVQGKKSQLTAAKIEARLYPGIPSDLQALFGVLATQANGTSLIFDTLYEGRLRYIDELKKMGADVTMLDPHRALITGPSVLHGTEVTSLDLRAGATLVIATLIADGQSILGNAEQIDRGYENIDERLRALGADIKRLD